MFSLIYFRLKILWTFVYIWKNVNKRKKKWFLTSVVSSFWGISCLMFAKKWSSWWSAMILRDLLDIISKNNKQPPLQAKTNPQPNFTQFLLQFTTPNDVNKSNRLKSAKKHNLKSKFQQTAIFMWPSRCFCNFCL